MNGDGGGIRDGQGQGGEEAVLRAVLRARLRLEGTNLEREMLSCSCSAQQAPKRLSTELLQGWGFATQTAGVRGVEGTGPTKRKS